MEEKEYLCVKFDKWRKFYPPYKCVCCGEVISRQQFIFSTLCGYCDLGRCSKGIGKFQEGHHKHLWKEAEIVTKLEILDRLEGK